MSEVKCIGLDVHKTSISAAVLDQGGKLVMQAVFRTEAAAILGFIRGVAGTLQVTFEEGTHAGWLHALLKPYVGEGVVCNLRKNALLKSGSKSDRIDARKLAELLRAGLLSRVYHGESHRLKLKELGRTYRAITDDTTRVMRRLKALYRSSGIDAGARNCTPAAASSGWRTCHKPAHVIAPSACLSNWIGSRAYAAQSAAT